MQHTDVFQELFQAIKEEAIHISDQVSQNEECENMEERFAIFHYENKGDFGDYSILLKNIRIIKDIVEKGLIVSKLNDICSKKGFLYKEYKATILRDTTIQIKEEDKAIRNYFLHSDVYPEPKARSPFYDLDITLSYNEWKNISFIKDKLNHIACYSCVSELMSKTFEQLPYEVFKSLYYIYYGVYDGALVNDVTTKIKNGDTPDILFLEENKDILRYVNDKKEKECSSRGLLPPVPSFSDMCIELLAKDLKKSGYITTEEEIEVFVGLFFKNNTTNNKDRIIIWNSGICVLKFFFLCLYNKWDSKEDIDEGIWPLVTEVFRKKDRTKYSDETLPNMDRDKVEKKVSSSANAIKEMINRAKMYQGG